MPPWLEDHVRQQHLTCSLTRQDDGTVRARISHTLRRNCANGIEEPTMSTALQLETVLTPYGPVSEVHVLTRWPGGAPPGLPPAGK